MKIAIPRCRRRMAPLFETARSFVLFDTDEPKPGRTQRRLLCLPDELAIDDKCRILHDEGVHVLLCGALSKASECHLVEYGIEVHSFLLGDIDEVVKRFRQSDAEGLLRLTMPGRRRYRGGPGHARNSSPCNGGACLRSTNKES